MKHGTIKAGRLPVFQSRMKILQGDLSVSEFAEKIGLSRQTTGFYLNGDRIPDAQTLLQICQECNVSADWLIGISPVETQTADMKLRTVSEVTGLSDIAVRTLSGINTYGPTNTHRALDLLLRNEKMWEFFMEDRPVDDRIEGINLFWHIAQYLYSSEDTTMYMVRMEPDTEFPRRAVEISAPNYVTHGTQLRALIDRASIETINDRLKQMRKETEEKTAIKPTPAP